MNSRQFDRGVSLLDVNGATLQFVERWEGTNFSHCFCRRRTRDYFGMINTLLVGGRGAIGAGLRTYLPRLDALYQIPIAGGYPPAPPLPPRAHPKRILG